MHFLSLGFLFYRWGNWGSEKLNLLKVIFKKLCNILKGRAQKIAGIAYCYRELIHTEPFLIPLTSCPSVSRAQAGCQSWDVLSFQKRRYISHWGKLNSGTWGLWAPRERIAQTSKTSCPHTLPRDIWQHWGNSDGELTQQLHPTYIPLPALVPKSF